MVGICKVGFRFESKRDGIYYDTIFTSNVGSTMTSFFTQPRYAHTCVGRSKLYLYLFIEVIWINGVCRV